VRRSYSHPSFAPVGDSGSHRHRLPRYLYGVAKLDSSMTWLGIAAAAAANPSNTECRAREQSSTQAPLACGAPA
jgi:hypothetical protein